MQILIFHISLSGKIEKRDVIFVGSNKKHLVTKKKTRNIYLRIDGMKKERNLFFVFFMVFIIQFL